MRVNFDWTRDPPPSNLTPFQVFTRDVNWEKSPLGPMNKWPNQLRQIVLLVMADPNPAVVYWGPEQAIIYNEAYVPLIGQKHPNLQGQNPRTGGFAEIWDHFNNVLKTGERTGEAHVAARSMLLLNRYGFLEETYFSWKFIPMVGEEGYIVASYATVIENTREFISDRRMLCVQELSSRIANATNLDQFWPAVLNSLSSNDKDVPLALVYSFDEGERCKLTGTFGVEPDHQCAPLELFLNDGNVPWAGLMQKALRASSPILARVEYDTLPQSLFSGVQWRGFGVPCTEFVLCPIKAGDLSAVLILGLNQRKPFDSDYQQFINLVTSQLITPHVLNIALAAEVAARKKKAEQAASDQASLSKQLSARTKEFQESMKFTRFADRAPIGLCVKDAAGSTIYANHAWTEFAGAEQEDVLDSNPQDLLPHDHVPLVHDWWKRLPQEGQNGTFQVRSKEPFISYSKTAGHMKADNKTGICATYADYDEERHVSTTMGLVVDISELVWIQDQVRQRTEELERSELNYRRFADNAPVGVCRYNRSGLIDFANEAWTAIFKQPGKSVNSATWMDSLHVEDLERFKAYLQDLKNFKVAPPIECRLRRPYAAFDQPGIDSHPAWILVSGHAEVGPDGVLESTVCWITDISAQKAAVKVMTTKVEEALGLKRQQENFIDAGLMISHEIRNPLSAVLHCAEEISQSIGAVLSQSNQSSLGRITHLESAADAAQTIVFCVQHQRRLVDDILTLSKLDSDLIRLDPMPVRPVQLIRRATSIFDKELKTASIALTIEESKSLTDLKLNWTILDPNRYLQVLINLLTNAIKFTRSCERKCIHIKIDATREKPSLNPGDIEYFPRSATDEASEESEDHVYMSVSVRDTGIGIQQAEKGALFKQFSQASPKTSIKYGGTGLGLFISRQITEMMGGEIGMSSVFGQGSTFAFFVKVYPVQSPSTADEIKACGDQDLTLTQLVRNSSTVTDLQQDYTPRRTKAQTQKTTDNALRVLVIEDNLINQRVLCKQLRNRGYAVEAANHGGEGISALRKAKDSSQPSSVQDNKGLFHVILCDIEMPVMNGIEFVKEVRRLEAEDILRGHSNIIAVTANARSGQVEKALEAGMDGFTTKPYQMNELIAEIDRICLSKAKTRLTYQ